jgi:hypothetical protein
MTQYTIGKDGKVKSKGSSKKPIELFPITKKIKEWRKKGKIKKKEVKKQAGKPKSKQPKKVWT